MAGIELCCADRVLMLDPFFTSPPIRYLFGGRVQPDRALVGKWIKSCDYLLITHAHWDHLMDAPEVIRLTGAKAYGSSNTCELLRLQGVPVGLVSEIKGGELVDFSDFKVGALPAEHLNLPVFTPGRLSDDLRPPLRLRDYRIDECYSYYLKLEGMRLLVWCGHRCPLITGDETPYVALALPRPGVTEIFCWPTVPVEWSPPLG